jgi:hypothetical protein
LIRFLVCSPLLLRNFVEIVFVELRIFRPVFFFLFDDLRDQFSTGAWLDLRERNRQLLVKVAGGKITMVRHVILDDAPACLDRLEFRMILRCTQNAMTSSFGSLVQSKGGSGSKFFAEFVQFGL